MSDHSDVHTHIIFVSGDRTIIRIDLREPRIEAQCRWIQAADISTLDTASTRTYLNAVADVIAHQPASQIVRAKSTTPASRDNFDPNA